MKPTTIILAIALAISPVLASKAEAHAKCTQTVTSRGRTVCTSSDPHHVHHSHEEEEDYDDIVLIIAGGFVLFFGGWAIYQNFIAEDEEQGKSIQFKPTVNYNSENDSLSYGIRYTIPLE